MPSDLQRIILTGFMGSGKSTVGRLLAAELDWRFLDLDTLIEERAGQTVPEIFAAQGEDRFRKLESEALADALSQMRAVIALGGGAPEILANRELLATTPASAIVYLAAPFETLYSRCLTQALDPAATARPNLATRGSAEARFTRRHPHYTALATYTLDSTGLTPAQTAHAVLQHIRQGQ